MKRKQERMVEEKEMMKATMAEAASSNSQKNLAQTHEEKMGMEMETIASSVDSALSSPTPDSARTTSP
jgi:hypothetical protein